VDEFSWTVKIKVPEKEKKVTRLLVAGPKGIRLLFADTNEETDYFPYKKMTEYSYNEKHEVFQFSWYPTRSTEELIFLHTKESKAIHGAITKFIKDILHSKNVKNPDKILSDSTVSRPPAVHQIAVGGRTIKSNPQYKDGRRKSQGDELRPNRKAGSEARPAQREIAQSEIPKRTTAVSTVVRRDRDRTVRQTSQPAQSTQKSTKKKPTADAKPQKATRRQSMPVQTTPASEVKLKHEIGMIEIETESTADLPLIVTKPKHKLIV